MAQNGQGTGKVRAFIADGNSDTHISVINSKNLQSLFQSVLNGYKNDTMKPKEPFVEAMLFDTGNKENQSDGRYKKAAVSIRCLFVA